MKANVVARRDALTQDEAGAFLVVEAMLVAVLILTAILFFTSVQRPTPANESRGINLGQVATDTLGILQRRSFGNTDPSDPEGWVTKVLGGDAAMAGTVDDFLNQVLPAGSRHYVRLSNGVGAIDLLPLGNPGLPRGSQAAETPLFPPWRAFNSSLPAAIASFATPGSEAASGSLAHQFTNPASYACIKSPTGASSGPKGSWASATYWKAALGRVPAWAMYGVWQGWPAADCTGTPAYLAVVPAAREITGASLTSGGTTLTTSAATFTARDVGRQVLNATALPAGTVISAYTSSTQVTLSKAATAAGSNLRLTVAAPSAYAVYGLQLVVWFGA